MQLARKDILPVEQRVGERLGLILPVTLETGDGEIPVNLVNLSRGGALGEAESPPRPGAFFTLNHDQLIARGIVTWVDGPRFGMTFDRLLEDDLIASCASAEPAHQ